VPPRLLKSSIQSGGERKNPWKFLENCAELGWYFGKPRWYAFR
jgi:hypothetical protein